MPFVYPCPVPTKIRINSTVFSVGNVSHANYIAHLFHIPLKSATGAGDGFTEQELYTVLALLFAYVFSDIDTASSFGLRAAAKKSTVALGTVLKGVCEALKLDRFTRLKKILGMESHEEVLNDYGSHLIERLFAGGKSIDEVVWTIVPTAAAAVATQAQGVS